MTSRRDIRVWLVDMESESALALADSTLPDDFDRARADSMHDPKAARLLLARRAAVKAVAVEALEDDPETIRVVRAPGGKPVIVSSRMKAPAISVAHSGRFLGVAVSTSASVGVDFEWVRPVRRARQIARRWFGEAEARELDAVGEAELTAAFFRMWTAKEALAKRHGAGLRLMKGRSKELDVGHAVRAGTLRYFDAHPGYIAAVASTEQVGEIRILQPEVHRWIT